MIRASILVAEIDGLTQAARQVCATPGIDMCSRCDRRGNLFAPNLRDTTGWLGMVRQSSLKQGEPGGIGSLPADHIVEVHGVVLLSVESIGG